jgi:hypothetical protein
LPFPNNFSVAVQQAIDNGSVLSVWRHLVNDIGSFYFGLTSHPQQGDYKRIALLICKKFPELRDSTPTWWVFHTFKIVFIQQCGLKQFQSQLCSCSDIDS